MSFKHHSVCEKHLGIKFIQGMETISYYQIWKKERGNTLGLVTYDSPSSFTRTTDCYKLELLFYSVNTFHEYNIYMRKYSVFLSALCFISAILA